MPIAVAHSALPEARTAVVAALDWARTHQTSLVVLHVEETGTVGTPGLPASESEVRAVEQEVQTVIDEQPGEAPDWRVVSTTSARDVASALLQLIAAHDVDLVVVGSRRRTEIGKFFMGRTVQRLVLDSPVPVLVVKNS
ncbi:universal stress protein [Ornithinimicrobium sp. F0845]|uniref:universal stress protein n=1 Tax=Ornithinimicrobium sp. F0845 TaxID=2926412 RepID=UPI001FF1DC81|nr:universal stress protein [Ornithinimicrobium sp. F0845]MCK0113764.1 universal stress protein [Ornithinimicrobium sp. F0845]